MKPGEHQIRERAYHIWEGEGRVLGRAEEHWLRAEAEFAAKAAAAPTDSVALPLTVQSSAPAMSDAPSPAKALKPRSSRAAGAGSRAVSAKAEEATRAVETAAAKAAPAKAAASKSSSAKPSVAKASTTKTSAGKAKSAPRNSNSPSIALH